MPSEMKRLRQLEEENQRLKRLGEVTFAEPSLGEIDQVPNIEPEHHAYTIHRRHRAKRQPPGVLKTRVPPVQSNIVPRFPRTTSLVPALPFP